MSHDHTHAHVSEGEVRRLVVVGFIMFAFGGIEAVIATHSHNVLLRADAAHNLTDGVFPVISAAVGAWAKRSHRHFMACRSKNLTALIGYGVMLILVAGAAWTERSELNGLSNHDLVVTAKIAIAGGVINFFSHRYLDSGGSHLEKANKTHLLWDILISFAIALGAIIDLIWQSPTGAALGLLGAVIIVAVVTIEHSIEIIRDLHIGRPHVDHPPSHHH